MRHAIRTAVLVLSTLCLAVAPTLAVVPATELFLPSVGRGQGACVEDVCSQWRTDVWVFNPSAGNTVAVEIAFLVRGADNTDPATESIELAPGETRELADIMQSLFGLDGQFGALRFAADHEVVVTSRIFDANVQTNLGVGTAGQFFAALPASMAIASGQSTDLVGLAQDATEVWRSNFGLVETTGNAVTVEASLVDANGSTLASSSYDLDGSGVDQRPIGNLGGDPGENYRLRVAVTDGEGRVLAFASRIDNRTGDPSTVEMVGEAAKAHDSGLFQGVVMTTDGLRLDGGIELVLTGDGLVEYTGMAGIQCDEDTFTVDFATSPTDPIALSADGSFTTSISIPYVEQAITLFVIDWTLSGVLDQSGVLSGTLVSEVHDAVGFWVPCNGISQRAWRAGWTDDSGR